MTLGKQAPYSSRTSDLGGLAKAHWLLSQIFVVCNVAGERVTWRPAARQGPYCFAVRLRYLAQLRLQHGAGTAQNQLCL